MKYSIIQGGVTFEIVTTTISAEIRAGHSLQIWRKRTTSVGGAVIKEEQLPCMVLLLDSIRDVPFGPTGLEVGQALQVFLELADRLDTPPVDAFNVVRDTLSTEIGDAIAKYHEQIPELEAKTLELVAEVNLHEKTIDDLKTGIRAEMEQNGIVEAEQKRLLAVQALQNVVDQINVHSEALHATEALLAQKRDELLNLESTLSAKIQEAKDAALVEARKTLDELDPIIAAKRETITTLDQAIIDKSEESTVLQLGHINQELNRLSNEISLRSASIASLDQTIVLKSDEATRLSLLVEDLTKRQATIEASLPLATSEPAPVKTSIDPSIPTVENPTETTTGV